MKLWQLILLLGNFGHHWTPVTADGTYRPIMNGSTLVNVEITGDPISVDLSNSNITAIGNNALDALINVKILDLSGNRIVTLPLGLFSKLNNLSELSLACPDIQLYSNGFHGLNNLMRLDLTGRWVSYLERGYFAGLLKSVNIMISRRSVGYLSTAMFENTTDSVFEMEETSEFDHPRFENHYLPYMLCMTDGIIESFEQGSVSDSCSYAEKIYPYQTNGEINLYEEHIWGFRKNWYQVKNLKIDTISFPNNHITDITPESINDLPSNIIRISFRDNNIQIIKNNGLENSNLRVLLLDRNGLEIIEDGAFEKLMLTQLSVDDNLLNDTNFIRTLPATLESLEISNNLITEIPPDTFSHLKKLKILHMSGNQLENLHPGTFEGLENLELINFADNKIHELKSGLFLGLEKLHTILFYENEIKEIHRDTFRGLKLSELDLSKNELEIIKGGAFFNSSIEKLNLGSNKINSIEEGAFNGAHIIEIDLSKNEITEFKKESWNGISGVKNFSLSCNPIKIIEKGSMLNLKDAKYVNLEMTDIEVLENGMLFGLSTDNVDVEIVGAPITLIQGGVFDDVLEN